MEKTPMEFIEGMSFREVPQNAPESVRGSISIKLDTFIEYAKKNCDERGWLNIKMMKSLTKGSIYFIKDSWKPQQKTENAGYDDRYKIETPEITLTPEEIRNGELDTSRTSHDPITGQDISLDDIPF